jgi:hypothetical protein
MADSADGVQILRHHFCDVNPRLCPALNNRLIITSGPVFRHEYALDYGPRECRSLEENKEAALQVYKNIKEAEWQGYIDQAVQSFGCEIVLVEKTITDHRIIGIDTVYCRRLAYFVAPEHTSYVLKCVAGGVKIDFASLA